MHERWLVLNEENSKLLETSLALYTSVGKILLLGECATNAANTCTSSMSWDSIHEMKKCRPTSNFPRVTVAHDHISSKNCKACQLNAVKKQKHQWTQIIQETTTKGTVKLLRCSVTEFNTFLIPEISSNINYHERGNIIRLA
jgi:hypothetical protein